MSLPNRFDFCILGAGLAGLSVAEKLLITGASVCMVDVGEIASGASGTPLGLVNPATGRWGTKTWKAEECFEAAASDLENVQNQVSIRFYKKTGILRPAQDKKMASRMKENVESQDWPEGWCAWLDEKEIRSKHADLNCVNGGMWLPEGLTVNVEAFLKAKALYLQEQGLKILSNADYGMQEKKSRFRFSFSDSSTDAFEAKAIIYTAGYETKNTPYWNFLPLIPVKGQVAVFESPLSKTFEYSISALGYLGSISDSHFVVGSTYEHQFEHTKPDKEGLDYLINRMSKVYPKLFTDAYLESQWAGVRASTPNRKPFVGQHSEFENIYVFAGLGSKGLLYSNYLGKCLVDYIFKETALPKEVSLDRI